MGIGGQIGQLVRGRLTERDLLSFLPYYPQVPRYRVLVITHNWLADKLNSLARLYVALS